MNKQRLLLVIIAAIILFIMCALLIFNAFKPESEHYVQENKAQTIEKDVAIDDSSINDIKPETPKKTEEFESIPDIKNIAELDNGGEHSNAKEELKPLSQTAVINQVNTEKQEQSENTTPAKNELKQRDKIAPIIRLRNYQPASDNVIVPITYSSKSTYKYIYTPTRFKSQR